LAWEAAFFIRRRHFFFRFSFSPRRRNSLFSSVAPLVEGVHTFLLHSFFQAAPQAAFFEKDRFIFAFCQCVSSAARGEKNLKLFLFKNQYQKGYQQTKKNEGV
jgi:hypothetical protein